MNRGSYQPDQPALPFFPNSIALAQRLKALPRDGLPLHRPVTVYWNDHQIPFIEAETDHDAAVTLGVVHVHLRWTQMELMRHVAHGRVSELIGPFGISLDRMLRTLDFGRAVPTIVQSLRPETCAWIEAFLAGINHAVAHLPAVPPEFRLLGLARRPWTLVDLLTVGRLAAADVTWTVWLTLLPDRNSAPVRALWRALLGAEAAMDAAGSTAAEMESWMRYARPGSNSWAVAPARSATGSAWIASDTHLPPLLPNLWLIAGYRSPSFHVAGLMIPGIPVVALGRNPWIAWGGTNLHAASSDLFDLSGLPPESIGKRREQLQVRAWRGRTLTLRDSPWGPVLSDLPRLRRGGGTYALRWMGHQTSDEVSALLDVNRGRDWATFRKALEGLAVPGQNMIYADTAGHIGKAMAVHLPRRASALPDTLLLPRDAVEAWNAVVRSRDLPAQFNPAEGFVASANDRPPETDVLIGYFFSSTQRITRLRDVLSDADQVDFGILAALQQDVVMLSVLPVRDRLVSLLHDRDRPDAAELAGCLVGWDGRYTADSTVPLVFELLLFHLATALYGRRMLRIIAASWNARSLMFDVVRTSREDTLRPALGRAIPRVQHGLRRFRTWGEMHRLEPRHPLAAIPLLGRRFRFGDWAAAGGSDTLMKTASPLSARRHHSSLTSTARHIADLGDMDANWFVLLGGQDGWLGSTTLLDQVQLWRDGAYIQVPLRPETVRALFRHRTELRP